MEKLRGEIHCVGALSAPDRDAMYALFARYYDSASRGQFERDLAEKDQVILLRDLGGVIRGFSTALMLAFEFGGRARRAIFSGDTIIDHAYWGTQTLTETWCRLAGRLRAAQPSTPLYWFLIVKGYRTYRYLPLFAREFFPTWRQPTPPEMKGIMDYLGARKFGAAYDAADGVVRFPESRGHLRDGWAEVPAHLRAKPDVRFFLERNPGYVRGEELVCLTELCETNLRSVARSAFAAAG